MSRAVAVLLGAQFLTALADNAILFTALAMLNQAPRGEWYVGALQAAFLVAFVVLAPWVGVFADSRSKPRVLLLGNVLKGAGAALLIIGVEPPVPSAPTDPGGVTGLRLRGYREAFAAIGVDIPDDRANLCGAFRAGMRG